HQEVARYKKVPSTRAIFTGCPNERRPAVPPGRGTASSRSSPDAVEITERHRIPVAVRFRPQLVDREDLDLLALAPGLLVAAEQDDLLLVQIDDRVRHATHLRHLLGPQVPVPLHSVLHDLVWSHPANPYRGDQLFLHPRNILQICRTPPGVWPCPQRVRMW